MSQPREIILTLRLNEQERRNLNAASAASGQTVSAYVRRAIERQQAGANG